MDIKSMNQYLNLIVERIKTHDPKEIILFGSLSKQDVTDDSDIDLIVILDVDSVPTTYEEKMLLKKSIRKTIRDINKKISIDLIVYTKKEYEFLKSENNPFLNEINDTGKILYEKAS